jgi:hypothetical protein
MGFDHQEVGFTHPKLGFTHHSLPFVETNVGIEDGKLGPTGELGRSVEATNMGIICAHMEIYCNQK